jgi:hypothetical protein
MNDITDAHREILQEIANAGIAEIKHSLTAKALIRRGLIKSEGDGYSITSLGYEAINLPYIMMPVTSSLEEIASHLSSHLTESQIADLVAKLFRKSLEAYEIESAFKELFG